jgi:hypothetical protein
MVSGYGRILERVYGMFVGERIGGESWDVEVGIECYVVRIFVMGGVRELLLSVS